MTEAFKLADKKFGEADTRAKQRYDRFVRSSILLHGDRVLVRNLSEWFLMWFYGACVTPSSEEKG